MPAPHHASDSHSSKLDEVDRDANRSGTLVRLAILAATIVALVWVSLSPLKKGRADQQPVREGDVALYAAEVQRMRAGEGYYSATAAELSSRGYPTEKLLNWRTPAPMWLLGQFPRDEWGKTILTALAAAMLLLGYAALRDARGPGMAALATLAATGVVILCPLGSLHVMPVLWAGVLIALSLACFGLRCEVAGVVCGLAALFLRDLAGPYCAASCVYALWHGRRREAVLWAVGIAAYFAFFAWHAGQVAAFRPEGGHAHAGSWLQFGGAAFVLSTAQINAYLLVAPQWCAAVFLSLALFGAAHAESDFETRTTGFLLLYILLFGFVGYDFNQYWGAMLTPAMNFAFAVGATACWQYLSVVRRGEPELSPASI